jgi:hypothetical protein
MTKTEAITELNRIMRMRHYALSTRESYSHWLGRFMDYLRRNRSLPLAPAERMEAFLSDLAKSLRKGFRVSAIQVFKSWTPQLLKA